MSIFFLNYFSPLERYRIQSEQFEDLWLITNELILRLKEYFGKQGIKDFSCSFSGCMPLQEYFELIDHHFEVCIIVIHITYSH
jgi:Bardet-Biedl syndrome 9 protein